MSINSIDIGKRIYALRKEKGYTQEKLAEILASEPYYINHERQYISRIEHGEDKALLDLPLLEALSDVFSCDISYLIGEIEEHTQNNKYICSFLGISEKAIENIQKNTHKNIFNALCENNEIYSIIFPILKQCVDDEVENDNNHFAFELVKQIMSIDDENERIDLEREIINKMEKIIYNSTHKNIDLSMLDAAIYRLSVESTLIYKKLIDSLSAPIIKENQKLVQEYYKSLGLSTEL